MFGVIIDVRVDPNREDEARTMLRDVILPKAKALPGFLGGQWHRAMHGDLLRSVHVYDSKDHAQATAAQIRSEGPPPGAPVILDSVDTYEVIGQA